MALGGWWLAVSYTVCQGLACCHMQAKHVLPAIHTISLSCFHSSILCALLHAFSSCSTITLQGDPALPLLSPDQRQSVIQLARCLADQPHLTDWVQRQVGAPGTVMYQFNQPARLEPSTCMQSQTEFTPACTTTSHIILAYKHAFHEALCHLLHLLLSLLTLPWLPPPHCGHVQPAYMCNNALFCGCTHLQVLRATSGPVALNAFAYHLGKSPPQKTPHKE
jgi:hypothetical protein